MHGAKVDSIDNWGMTALDLAIEYKSKIMVTLLTSLGGKNLYALSSSDNEIEKFIEGNQKDNFKKAYEYVRPYMILFNKNMIEQYYDGYLSRISVDGFRNTIDNQKEQLKDFLKTRKYLYSCDGDCNMKMIDDIQEMINEKLEEFQMRKSLTL
ncbi:MAG: hypothetical protein BGO27_01090 [Alphaproteobacteria bacterium 33-17]|nr:MAG: hypothetical protein BGO27_01090 [Alphaproteobacteria bacterium 33-17]